MQTDPPFILLKIFLLLCSAYFYKGFYLFQEIACLGLTSIRETDCLKKIYFLIILGEVTVYNLSKTEETNFYEPGSTEGAAVTSLQWVSVPMNTTNKFMLASATSDGTVLIWDMSTTKEIIQLQSGYIDSA